MNGGRAAGCALAGALLIAGALSVSALAAPIVREGPRGPLPGEVVATEGSSTGVGDALQEVRRTGPGFAPNLFGIDDGFLTNGSLLHSELRERILAPNRAGSAGGPDLFRETLDNALRTTRDAFFDSADTASFSLAGVELSVTVRGDRRGLSVAGVELLGASAGKRNVAGALGNHVGSRAPRRSQGGHHGRPALCRRGRGQA